MTAFRSVATTKLLKSTLKTAHCLIDTDSTRQTALVTHISEASRFKHEERLTNVIPKQSKLIAFLKGSNRGVYFKKCPKLLRTDLIS